MSGADKLVVKGGEVSDFIAHLTTRPLLALFAVFIFATVQLIKHGARGDYLLLLVGSILSAAAMMAYAFLMFAHKDRRSPLLMIVAFGGLIPYLLGSYLVFYRGLWRLKDLSAGFSIVLLLKAACFVSVGYTIVSGIYKVSEFVRKVRDGEILIE